MTQPIANDANAPAFPFPSAAPLGQVSAQRVIDAETRAFLQRRLQAVILLAGALRPDALQRATRRFLLELPIEPGRTVQDRWQDQVRGLAEHLCLDRLPVRVLIDRLTRPPRQWPRGGEAVSVSIERDPSELRGTGGLLRDVVAEYDDDAYVFVADAGQLLFDPLWSVLHRLGRMPGDVRLLARGDGSPAGMMLVRCGCLRDLPAVGFVDFKEQGLPRLAASHAVHVAPWRGRPAGGAVAAPGLPVRRMASYLDALRCWARRSGAALPAWGPAFALIEPGAVVARSAVLHDAVVLAGGSVEEGAALVRCIVCPGGSVRAGRTRMDALIAPRGGTRRQPSPADL